MILNHQYISVIEAMDKDETAKTKMSETDIGQTRTLENSNT